MSPINPLVSIGMPVYNGERFLEETLKSIISQTFTDFELIISDNCSNDRTEKICRAFAEKDKRIRYFRCQQNIGAAKNYNRVFELAKGQYFKWAAHDDLLAPNFLKRCVEILDVHPSVVLSYTREVCIDEDGFHIKKRKNLLNFRSKKPTDRFRIYHQLWRKRGFVHSNQCFGLIRTKILKQTPLIQCYVWAEIALCSELLFFGEFYEVPEFLFFFREHSGSSRAIRKKGGYKALSLWFGSDYATQIIYPNWNLLLHFYLIIQRAPISTFEKFICHIQLLKWCAWKWKVLLREVISAPFDIS